MRGTMRNAPAAALAATFAAALAACAPRTRADPAVPAAATAADAGPELFGEGVFSTGAWDFFVAFTPDERTAYFCRADGRFSHFTILQSHQRGGGRWSKPEVAPFSGRWSDADPHVSPDGGRLFWISNRPLPGAAAPADTARDDYDIWYVERTAG